MISFIIVVIHNHNLPTIEDVIPHRPPSLWLSGVLTVDPGHSAHGFWVPGNEHYEGHFGILMGHKQAESLAQLGAYAMMLDNRDSIPLLTESHITPLAPIVPKSAIDLTIEIVDSQRHLFKAIGRCSVDGETTSEAEISGCILSARSAQRLLGAKAITR